MLKKVLTGTGIAAALTGMFLLGSLALAPVFAAQTQDTSPPPQVVAQDTDNIELEEQVGDQSELDDDAAEDAVGAPDMDNVDNQVEQDAEFDGEA